MSLEYIGAKYVPTKNGSKNGFVSKRMVIRMCDECKKQEEVGWHAAMQGRKVRKVDIDLCKACANLGKFRKLPRGRNNGHWKHGKDINGYDRITTEDGRRILVHKWVMENAIGRQLLPGEVVHHIDCDKNNNEIKNLHLFPSRAEHLVCHRALGESICNLLGTTIWFDWERKEYSLTTCDQPEEKYIPPLSKVYVKRDPRNGKQTEYCFYSIRLAKNKHVWKKQHVYVAEELIGRRLHYNEIVYHVNGNTKDNRSNNLCVMTKVEHGACHKSLQMIGMELYKRHMFVFRDGKYCLSS